MSAPPLECAPSLLATPTPARAGGVIARTMVRHTHLVYFAVTCMGSYCWCGYVWRGFLRRVRVLAVLWAHRSHVVVGVGVACSRGGCRGDAGPGAMYANGSETGSNKKFGAGSILTLKLDMDAGTLSFDLDNEPQSVVLRHVTSRRQWSRAHLGGCARGKG